MIQAKKELVICADLKPEDVFFYYTTTCVALSFQPVYLSRVISVSPIHSANLSLPSLLFHPIMAPKIHTADG